MLSSPFPGMDPYLEDRWPEVHASLIVYARNQINQRLPNDLQANIEENLAVYAEDQGGRTLRPEVNISEDAELATSSVAVSNVAVAEPMVVRRNPHPNRHVEITSSDGRIITAIEFISPWNKVGARSREQYTSKQIDYIAAGVNLVEIDLVRQGSYVLAAQLSEIPEASQKPYMICIYRDMKPNQFEIFQAPLQERLPNIPIPLRPGDRDVVLELQPLIDACYRDGRYYRIDYRLEPKGKFDEQDSAWIANRLREQGKRS